MLEEMLERRGLPQTAVHLHAPPEGDVDIHDPKMWRMGNPGLAIGIKSMDYMAAEAARVTATPSDLGSFLAYDLNLPQSPSREMLCAPEDLKACWVEELPPREGTAFIGLDFGGAQSGSSAYIVWPQTGRCEMRLAFGDVPDLVARGRQDAARYDLMAERGEVHTYPGRVTPVDAFLRDLAENLAGVHVGKLAADGYKGCRGQDIPRASGAAVALRVPARGRWQRWWEGRAGNAAAHPEQAVEDEGEPRVGHCHQQLRDPPRRQRQPRTGQADVTGPHRPAFRDGHRLRAVGRALRPACAPPVAQPGPRLASPLPAHAMP